MLEQDFDLQVIISSGIENPQKATLGLATALAAASTDAKVVVFFTMDGAIWAHPDHGHEVAFPKFEKINEYLEWLRELNVVLEGCSSCVDQFCPPDPNNNDLRNIRPGFILSGLSTAAMRAMNTPTLVF